jgi:hypothetical protein
MVEDLKKSLFIFCIFLFFSFSTFPTEGDDPGLVGHVGTRHWERGGFVPVDIRGRRPGVTRIQIPSGHFSQHLSS